MKDYNATVIVDLDKKEKKLWKELHKDARWGVRKAQDNGLSVKISNNEKDWKEFYEIYKEVVRLGGGDVFPLDEIKQKSEAFFVCKLKEKVIGGATIWFSTRYDKTIPRLYVVASDKNYWNFQPNNLIYWSCILWAKEKGNKKFDLGGWQINARGHLIGVNKFKEKWGKVIIYTKDYPVHVAIGRKLIRNTKIFRNLWDLFKGRRKFKNRS